MKLTLKLPWAPTANLIWRNNRRTGRTYLSPEYRAFLTNASADYLIQGSPKASSGTALQITIRLFPPNRKYYDVDNRIKPVLDALTKIGFWTDDRFVRKVTAIACVPVEKGAVIVEVEPFENENDGLYGLQPIADAKRKKRT